MVESELDVEKVEYLGISYTGSEHQASGLRRDPSFSRWCDEDGNVLLGHQLRHADSRVSEDSDFELPILNRDRLGKTKSQEKRILLNSGGTMDDKSSQFWEKGSDKYIPFDVEKRSAGEVSDNEALQLAGDSVGPQISESTLSVANVLKTVFLILVWYTFSLFLTLYNKSLLGDKLGNFPAPLLMNTVHFGLQAILSRFITWFWSRRFQPSVAMSWKDYWVRVVPTAFGTAMDVNLSNASLVSISVTFATMCKSGAPIFLLLFAFAFRLENPSLKLSGIMTVISIGILLTVAKETNFEFWGFFLVMLAAVMSGFRWCMTQILLQKEVYGLKNPLTLMSYVTPVMMVVTAILSLVLDPWDEFRKNNYFNNPWHITRSCLLMLFGGILAFFMVLTEYILVSVTSAVTVTIAGVVKEAITILVAVLYFHDEFTWLKGAGLLTIIVGVSLFNWYKYEKLRKAQIGERSVESPTNSHAKYVILEEMDEQEDQS